MLFRLHGWRVFLRWPAAFGLLCAGLTASRAGEETIRIGVIGLDTSHAVSFLRIFNDPSAKNHVAGARIVAAYRGGSPEIASSASRIDGFTRTAVEQYQVKLCGSIEELAREVDALMILSVDGRQHLDQFRRTLDARKPVFIDKPFAGTLADAVEMVRLAAETRTPVFSSSSLRYTLDSPARQPERTGPVGLVYSHGPADIEPHHPDLFWYGVHVVEAMYAVLGPGCRDVVRSHTDGVDVATGVWADGRVGVMLGYRGGYRGYGVTAIGPRGAVTGGQKESFQPLAEDILKFFRTGIAPVPLETTLEIFAFMEAADESKRRAGRPVPLSEVLRLAGRSVVE